MAYRVTAQYGSGRELLCQQFQKMDDAKHFIMDSLRDNAAMKINVVYRLYEWDDLLHTFSSADPSMQDDTSSLGGQGKGASFRPSPLNTSPRPAGMPHSSFKDDDKEKGGK